MTTQKGNLIIIKQTECRSVGRNPGDVEFISISLHAVPYFMQQFNLVRGWKM